MGNIPITQFANDTTPALPELDQNFAAFGRLAPIPCTISGTNTLSFTQNGASQASSVELTAYENQVQICGIAAITNTTTATAAVGTLPQIPIYKDTLAGPVALGGGEIIAGNSITLRYDSSLNSGNGGWHLVSGAQGVGNTINPSLVRASIGVQVGATTSPTLIGLFSGLATLTYTSIVPGSSQDQSFTMSGVSVTDVLALGLPIPVSTGLSYSGYLTNAGTLGIGTVTIRALNATAASTITPGTITVNAKALRTA